MKKTIFLIRGLPGSGKSTIARMIVEQYKNKNTIVHTEADHFFHDENGVYNFDASKIKDAHSLCQEIAECAMQCGVDVVVSNTFVRKWEMDYYIDIAKKYEYGVVVIVARGDYQNVHGVPPETIERMKGMWEE